jgi:hypothetical protein
MTIRRGLAIQPVGAREGNTRLTALPVTTIRGVWSSDPRRYAFPLGFAAMLLTFGLPSNLLHYLGLYSGSPAGNPLTKFLPGTYVIVVAACVALYGRRHYGGLTGLFRERPVLAWSIFLFVASATYSALRFGISGAAVYVETYLAAAFLSIALQVGAEHQRRILGYAILTFCLVDVGLSVMEGIAHVHFVPSQPAIHDDKVGEFRGAGLYSHPLVGSLVTAMALFLVLGMRLKSWVAVPAFGALIIGLLSFGGRSAFLTTVAMIAAAALFRLVAGLVTRRLSIGFLAAFIAGSLLLPALLVVLTTTTDIGQRIMTHLYIDDSANVRVIQWRVLDFLHLEDVLFGVHPDQIDVLKAQIGLIDPDTDIENFWLLMFLNLGLFGFPLLAAALLLLLLHLARETNMPTGWMIVISTLLIASTSNSLARKSPDLVFLVAFTNALSGFRPERHALATYAAPSGPVRRTALAVAPERRRRALADRPVARSSGIS